METEEENQPARNLSYSVDYIGWIRAAPCMATFVQLNERRWKLMGPDSARHLWSGRRNSVFGEIFCQSTAHHAICNQSSNLQSITEKILIFFFSFLFQPNQFAKNPTLLAPSSWRLTSFESHTDRNSYSEFPAIALMKLLMLPMVLIYGQSRACQQGDVPTRRVLYEKTSTRVKYQSTPIPPSSFSLICLSM